jgi:ABC-2 type transport system ATP-binding protein
VTEYPERNQEEPSGSSGSLARPIKPEQGSDSPNRDLAPVIDVTGLTKDFGPKRVVDHFDIRVPKGSIYGFLGPNGSGKTTTIRMLCGLLTPDAGEGTCLGFDVRRDAEKIKEQVGYMTQKFSLYEDLTIRENLDFVARMYRLSGRRKAVDQALAELGLADRSNQLAGTLSGGWKQRLALAACLLHNPRLLLLDEPTAGVDPKARRDFWDEIRRLAAEGVTILVSTHYMDEAIQCDFIAYIAYGRKLIDGPSAGIPAQIGLVTWYVDGPDLGALEARIKTEPGVEQVARFGASLHVSGTDRAALESTVRRYEAEGTHHWRLEPAGLEEAFIYLMAGARDNFSPETAQRVPA